MPDAALTRVLQRVQRQWRIRSIAHAVAAGGAVFALAVVVSVALAGAGRTGAIITGILAGLVTAVAIVIRTPRLTLVGAASAIEAADRTLENLLVTAAELAERPRQVNEAMHAEIDRLAAERLGGADRRVVPVAQPIGVAALVVAGCVVLAGISGDSVPLARLHSSTERLAAVPDGSFAVTITPPAYSRRPVETVQAPVQITVLAGSRIQIPAINRDWVATESEGIEIRTSPTAELRFLAIAVVPDLAPTIRIVTPGKDSVFAEPAGRINVSIHSGDDLGLSSVTLRYTKASGGGENVSFEEGEVALRIERVSEREWRAGGEFTLESMKLAEGDIVVYRAMARDTNPAGTPTQSDQFLIEIGKNAVLADAGFALPAEEKKYAISQQMVIYHTENLLKNRARLAKGGEGEGSGWLNESRNIAVEQRMVRAEVVFLGGGEVEDEVEEAAHSHELAEGRLENSGRAEMLRAINAMSRAETELNGGKVTEALALERQALTHLERALDRRRYFLRTLPDRSRIDASRRLTGERREARSWDRDGAVAVAPGSLEAQRRVMRELAAGASVNASLAARVAAVDPASDDLQKAAVGLASASTAAARAAASQAAMAALTRHALQRIPGSSAVSISEAPLAGALSSELAAAPRRQR